MTISLPRLILASTSPYRRALLERLGQPFECRRPSVDEDAEKHRWTGTPIDLVRHLARAKALSVVDRTATVIGFRSDGPLGGAYPGQAGPP